MSSISKKTQKFLRDPQRFFADSRHGLLRGLGSAIATNSSRLSNGPHTSSVRKKSELTAAPKDPPKSAAAQPTTRANAKTPPPITAFRSFDSVMNLLLGEGIDPFAWYRQLPPSPNSNVYILPTGDLLWDRALLRLLEGLGFKSQFLPLWQIGQPGMDTDDIEYKSRKEPLWLSLATNQLASNIRSGDVLIVPFDHTPFTRSLLIASHNLGARTLLVPYPRIDSSAQTPPPAYCEAVIPSSAARQLRTLVAPPSTGGQGRLRLGASDTAPLVVAYMPSLQLRADRPTMEAANEQIVAQALQLCGDIGSLVVVVRNKNGAGASATTRKTLTEAVRKYIVPHGSPELEELLCDPDVSWVLGSDNDEPGAENTPALGEVLGDTVSGLSRPAAISRWGDLVDRILDPSARSFQAIAVPDPLTNIEVTNGRQRYLCELLNANSRVYGAGAPEDVAGAEVFLQWGAEPNEAKSRPEIYRTAFRRRKLYVEDGFIRSMGLWTDPNEPAWSVTIDPQAVYYDATRPSLLVTILNSDWEPSAEEIARARGLIERIVRERISKYNYAPTFKMDLFTGERRRILLVDQKAGDMSLKYGLASSETFERMLREAHLRIEDSDIVIKQHPCAITGGAEFAHFTRQSLGAFAEHPRVRLLAHDINPYSLMDEVDEVWVASSGMGFEALLAGKHVTCFGAPFYAGWGITDDKFEIPCRARRRTIEAIFVAFYLRLTRYWDPARECPGQLEDLLDYISLTKHQP